MATNFILPLHTIKYVPLFLLSACGTTGVVNLAEPEHNTVTVEKMIRYECGTAPSYEPFIRLRVVWAEGMTIDGKPAITLDDKNYRNLGKNTARLEKAVTQVKAQRDFYKDCIDRSQEIE